MASDSVSVRVNQLPQIISRLTGTEGSVSLAPRKVVVFDPEGVSLFDFSIPGKSRPGLPVECEQ